MAGSARKRRISAVIKESSSNEEEDEKLNVTGNAKVIPRSSERIRKKKSKSFTMPSREELWKDISPEKPSKYNHLKPRKLVNNFTRETHRYNYDPMYTSGSESMEDFLDDEDIADSSSSGFSEEKEQKSHKHSKKHRIAHRHSRIVREDSDSSDECPVGAKPAAAEVDLGANVTSTAGTNENKVVCNSSSRSSKSNGKKTNVTDNDMAKMELEKDFNDLKSKSCNKGKVENEFERKKGMGEDTDDDSEGDFAVTPKIRRKSNVINSDDEDDIKDACKEKIMTSTPKACGSDIVRGSGRHTRKQTCSKSSGFGSDKGKSDVSGIEDNDLHSKFSKKKDQTKDSVQIISDESDENVQIVGVRRNSSKLLIESDDDDEKFNRLSDGKAKFDKEQKSVAKKSDGLDADGKTDKMTLEKKESSDEESDDDDDDESESSSDDSESEIELDPNMSSRTRVQMLRKKQAKEALFAEFRKARQHHLSKDNSF